MIPREFTGGWVRDGISYDGGPFVEDTTVWWLQGPSRHADLRTPHGAGPVTCFAGDTTWDGSALTWHHQLDLTPWPSTDLGAMSWEGDVLLETGSSTQDGRTTRYVERWVSLPDGESPLWTLRSATGWIVRTGAYALTVVDGRAAGGAFGVTAWVLRDGIWVADRAIGATTPAPPTILTDLPGGWTVDETG